MKQNALATRTIRRLRGLWSLRAVLGAVPPVGLVVLGILSVQIGAAFAKALFPVLGPYGTVFLRLVFAALILMIAWRPRVRGHRRGDYLLVLLFGLVFAAMNTSFYAALDRVPLGVAVTVEFIGPLGVAVFGSRKLLDLLWAVLAAGGIVLLTPLTGVSGVSNTIPRAASTVRSRSSSFREPNTATPNGPINSTVTATPRGRRSRAA